MRFDRIFHSFYSPKYIQKFGIIVKSFNGILITDEKTECKFDGMRLIFCDIHAACPCPTEFMLHSFPISNGDWIFAHFTFASKSSFNNPIVWKAWTIKLVESSWSHRFYMKKYFWLSNFYFFLIFNLNILINCSGQVMLYIFLE